MTEHRNHTQSALGIWGWVLGIGLLLGVAYGLRAPLWGLMNFALHIDQHLLRITEDYGIWVYALLFLIVFCETGLVVLPFLPGDSLLFVAGSVAAFGHLNVHLLVGLLLLAAILGDWVNFQVGKHLGVKPFENPNSRIFKREYLAQTEQFYEKYGAKTIIIARFVPIVRTFAPFVAGMGRMRYQKFMYYNALGAFLWVVLLSYAGYFLGRIAWVQKHLGAIIIGIIVVSVLPAVIEVMREYRKSRLEKKV
ncbi:MAG: DedA family protein [Cardiobacteriaceae bacterium]|nr:DedA family protein [Cardiobacteriaceae bacterium]